MILDLLKKKQLENNENQVDYIKEIKKTKNKQENLFDMRLEDRISEELYLSKNNKFEENIRLLNEQKNNKKKDGLEDRVLKIIELYPSFYTSYSLANNELKAKIIRKLQIELFVDNKKELTIKENKLFEIIRDINYNGTTTGQAVEY